MPKDAIALTWSDWADTPHTWNGTIEGDRTGTDLTLLIFTTDEVGAGPKLHVHTYDEVFIVRKGRALFTVGDRRIEATAGAILMAPAHVPHKFSNLGPGPLETTDIHMSPVFAQTYVHDPETE